MLGTHASSCRSKIHWSPSKIDGTVIDSPLMMSRIEDFVEICLVPSNSEGTSMRSVWSDLSDEFMLLTSFRSQKPHSQTTVHRPFALSKWSRDTWGAPKRTSETIATKERAMRQHYGRSQEELYLRPAITVQYRATPEKDWDFNLTWSH
jgi:hypothetical protein